MSELSFYCKIDSIEKLKSHPSDKVRWIEMPHDFEMLMEFAKAHGIDITSKVPHTMYFGIYVDENLEIQPDDAKLCAYIDGGNILSLAARFISDDLSDAWEIGAVSTHPQHLRQGYSKAVCSVAAKYILENGKLAVSETHIDNIAMQKVFLSIGMTEVEKPSVY